MGLFSFWTEMDKDRKSGIVRVAGLFVLVFALFCLLSTVSYIFTWQADQSILGSAGRFSGRVENSAGRLGAMLAYRLIGDWFGLGAFTLVLMVFIIGIKMLGARTSYSVLRVLSVTITAAILLSLICAFISLHFGLDTALCCGLGGSCGSMVVNWFQGLVGVIPTAALLLVLLAAWFYFTSAGFSRWFVSLGSGKPRKKQRKTKSMEPEESKPAGSFGWGPKSGPEKVAEAVEKEENHIDTPVNAPESGPAHAPGDEAGIDILNPGELSTDVGEELPRIDVRDELKDYKFPPLELLKDYAEDRHEVPNDELLRNNAQIRRTLKNFGIGVENVKAIVGPTVTLYKVYPSPGVKIASIKSRQEDIALGLNARGVRVVTLEDSVGIEVANDRPSTVPLRAMLNDETFRESKAELPIAIGCPISQTKRVLLFDLTDAPHLLVAGATKQGKSVGLNVLIMSLLYSRHPSELKFVFIDPKFVEFSSYARLLHHYLAVVPSNSEEDEKATAIANTAEQADKALRSLCIEMDERYELLRNALVNNVKDYNEMFRNRKLNPNKGHRFLPYIVVIVDEYAELTMSAGVSPEAKAGSRSVSSSIIRLAQKGRAAGIHVVLTTQRPSVDVVTGLIKANFPARIAYKVSSSVDSKTILDAIGADKLIGRGDMIFRSNIEMERAQCAFISSSEINAVCDFIAAQRGYKKSYNTPYYLPEPDPESSEDGVAAIDMKKLDERFEEAAKLIVLSQRGSTSDLQRKLGMGYAKAGRVMDQLEAAGIVGPQQGSKPREVLVQDLAGLEKIIDAFRNGYKDE